VGVGREEVHWDAGVADAFRAAYGDSGELDGCSDPSPEVRPLLPKQPSHLTADRAAAEQRDT